MVTKPSVTPTCRYCQTPLTQMEQPKGLLNVEVETQTVDARKGVTVLAFTCLKCGYLELFKAQ